MADSVIIVDWNHSHRSVRAQRHLDRGKLSTSTTLSKSAPPPTRDQELGDSCQKRGDGNHMEGNVKEIHGYTMGNACGPDSFPDESLLCIYLCHHISVGYLAQTASTLDR